MFLKSILVLGATASVAIAILVGWLVVANLDDTPPGLEGYTVDEDTLLVHMWPGGQCCYIEHRWIMESGQDGSCLGLDISDDGLRRNDFRYCGEFLVGHARIEGCRECPWEFHDFRTWED